MYQPPMQGVQPQMQIVQPGYAPQPTMATVPGQANVVVVTQVVQRPPKDWSHSLLDCFGDCATCCLATFVPCFVYGQNKAALNKHEGCCGDCCLYCCCPWCVGSGGRTSIRAKYNITGDSCGDCCAHLCCTPCALTQEKREIDGMIAAGMN
ncbi:PLAC8 family-domain-containing protein [Gaertneriomyces semiglobifer]|nr:PLAC8 family-domain-containing protein [Gaertneriomyces semiglobifer]